MSDNDQSSDNNLASTVNVKIVSLCGRFSDDHKRVRVEFELTDADRKPTVELSLIDSAGVVITHAVIMGVLVRQMYFTLHLGKHPSDKPVWVKILLRTDDHLCLDEKTEPVE